MVKRMGGLERMPLEFQRGGMSLVLRTQPARELSGVRWETGAGEEDPPGIGRRQHAGWRVL